MKTFRQNLKNYIASVYKKAGKLGNSGMFSKICIALNRIEISL